MLAACVAKNDSHSEKCLIRLTFETRCESNLSVRPKCSHRCVLLKAPLAGRKPKVPAGGFAVRRLLAWRSCFDRGDWKIEPEEFPIDLARGDVLSRPLAQEGGTAPTQPDMLILTHATRISTEQTSMRTKWFKPVAIRTVQEHLLHKFSSETPKIHHFISSGCTVKASCPSDAQREQQMQEMTTYYLLLDCPEMSAQCCKFNTPKMGPAMAGKYRKEFHNICPSKGPSSAYHISQERKK